MLMKNNDLIEQLSNLKLEEKSLKRNLDRFYYDVDARTKLFERIEENKKEINNIKFKIRLEREIRKNENNN